MASCTPTPRGIHVRITSWVATGTELALLLGETSIIVQKASWAIVKAEVVSSVATLIHTIGVRRIKYTVAPVIALDIVIVVHQLIHLAADYIGQCGIVPAPCDRWIVWI